MSLTLCPADDALFLDIDGTLLDIVATPQAVVVPAALTDQLSRLHAKLNGALALVSGRSLDNIDALFAPLILPASGVHGAQWRLSSTQDAPAPLSQELRDAICQAFLPYPLLTVEDKGYAIAVHYRTLPHLAPMVKDMLQELLADSAQPISLLHGKMVCEVVSAWHNKGSAIRRFMAHAPFAGRRPVFLGDDETDLFASQACLKMGGVAAHVGYDAHPFGHSFATPGEVRDWIGTQAR